MTAAEKLYTQTFVRSLKAQGFIFALRQVVDLGTQLGSEVLRVQTQTIVHLLLEHYAIFKDTQTFVGAGLHNKMADEISEMTIKQAQIAVDALGGHLKTGHRWSLQNRPTGRVQDMTCFTLS
jgi:hypothetical protein